MQGPAEMARRPVPFRARLACASACSRMTVIQASIFGLNVWMRSRQACVSSTGETLAGVGGFSDEACREASSRESAGRAAMVLKEHAAGVRSAIRRSARMRPSKARAPWCRAAEAGASCAIGGFLIGVGEREHVDLGPRAHRRSAGRWAGRPWRSHREWRSSADRSR